MGCVLSNQDGIWDSTLSASEWEEHSRENNVGMP